MFFSFNYYKLFFNAYLLGCSWDNLTCEFAVQKGNLECLQYAVENGCKWDIPRCLQIAKTNGFTACEMYILSKIP